MPIEEILAQTEPLFKTMESPNDFQLEPSVLTTPFKKIALALSGGGFRAASFSLGAMSYLHHLKYPESEKDQRVLDNVEFISSASGGTFAGILYSMHVRQGIPFQKTYTTLLSFMTGQVLLEDVLKLINDESKWNHDKSRNFINGFARIYDEKLFENQTFGLYWQRPDESIERNLEVCFNTTEFYRGLSFRFQTTNDPESISKTGNSYVFFNKKNELSLNTLKKIKLGDIMASSSCFPGGFEPILFPKDFAYRDSHDKSLTTQALKEALLVTNYNNTIIDHKENIGFMDGGIDDNQGVYSAMVADVRRRHKNSSNGFDLVLITDVASYFMDPYEAPIQIEKGNFRKTTVSGLLFRSKKFITKINRITKTMLISSSILLFISLWALFTASSILIHDFALVVGATSGTVLIIATLLDKFALKQPFVEATTKNLDLTDAQTISLIKENIPSLKNFSETTLSLMLQYLKQTPIAVLEQMLKARVNSTLSLVMDVNLKQTRRLIFDIFFENFYGAGIWEQRRVFNVIYELSVFNRESRLAILGRKFHKQKFHILEGNSSTWAQESIDILTSHCDKLQVVAESARTMGTTLWFDELDADKKRVEDVVACGQFTTCAKMLEYAIIIERLLEIQEKNPSVSKTIDFDAAQLVLFRSIKLQLLNDWVAFKNEPTFLVKLYSLDTK